MIFLIPRDEPAVIWHPATDRSEIQIASASRCIGGNQLRVAASSIRANGVDWELGFQGMIAKPRPKNQDRERTVVALPQRQQERRGLR